MLKICILFVWTIVSAQGNSQWKLLYPFNQSMTSEIENYSIFCTDDEMSTIVEAQCQCIINDMVLVTPEDVEKGKNLSMKDFLNGGLFCSGSTSCTEAHRKRACGDESSVSQELHSVCDMVDCADRRTASVTCKNTKKCIICREKGKPNRTKQECQVRATLRNEIDKIVDADEQTSSSAKQKMTALLLENFDSNYSAIIAEQKNTVEITSPNLDVRVIDVASDANSTITFNDSLTKVTIPSDQVASQVTAVVARWKGISRYLQNDPGIPPSCSGDSCPFIIPANSSMITVNMYETATNKTLQINTHPVQFVIDLKNDLTVAMSEDMLYRRVTNVTRTCGWWNDTNWSTYGCHSVTGHDHYPSEITCSCNHTTSFASLLSVESVEPPEWVYNIEMLMQLVTIIFLVITILFVIAARLSKALPNQPQSINRSDVRNNRTITQLCLCLSLIGLHVFLIISDKTEQEASLCYACAVLLHVFLISAAMWLLNEGIALVLKTSRQFLLTLNYKLLSILQLITGWLLPILIVAITTIIAKEDYIELSETYKQFDRDVVKFFPQYIQCIPNLTRNYWIFKSIVGILIIIIGTNFILIIRTVFVVYHVSKKDNRLRYPESMNCGSNCSLEDRFHKHKHWGSVLKAFMILLPVSSLPWAMWMLTVVPDPQLAADFVQAHTIVNGLQGLGIFIVYCVMNKEDQARIKEQWHRSDLKRLLDDLFSSLKGSCHHDNTRANLKKHQSIHGSTEMTTINTGIHDERCDSNTTNITHLSP